MSSREGRTNTRSRRREQEVIDLNGTPSEHQRDQQGTRQQAPVVTPMIDVDAIEDDDDVVISTASAFAQAKNKSRRRSRGSEESGGTNRVTKNRTRLRSDQANNDCDDELNKSKKSKAVAPPVEEPQFNCPICMSPFTEETTTKCGHIFCKACIKNAISRQAKCPTCRNKVGKKDLIRIFLPTTK